jgi:GTPase SAR1 family protein
MYNTITTVVGKTNILTQYIQNKFLKEHEITIGVEFTAKNITIGNDNIRIQIWDTVILLTKRLDKSHSDQ